MNNIVTQQNRAGKNKGRLAFEIGYKRFADTRSLRKEAAQKRNTAERRLGRAIAQNY